MYKCSWMPNSGYGECSYRQMSALQWVFNFRFQWERLFHLMAGFWGFLQLVCHVFYSWTFSGLCAAYDHSSYGCGYCIKVHGPCGIVLDDSAGPDTRNSRCSSSNSWYISRGFSTWSCGPQCLHISCGVNKNSGQCRRSPYHWYAGGQKCWYGRSSWQAGRWLSWNK